VSTLSLSKIDERRISQMIDKMEEKHISRQLAPNHPLTHLIDDINPDTS
jgi:hypothetical protein